MEFNLQEILTQIAQIPQEEELPQMTDAEIKATYNYFNKKFANFTFKFKAPVEKIVLICDVLPLTELTVPELFKMQKSLRQQGGLAHWITLEIYYADKNAVSYMSFDH